jgi:cysteine desulfurase/selenocysteine lyase
LRTIQEFYRTYNANIRRSPHLLGQEATELYDDAHRNVARFIGAGDGGEIIFLRNSAKAINLVAYSGRYRTVQTFVERAPRAVRG